MVLENSFAISSVCKGPFASESADDAKKRRMWVRRGSLKSRGPVTPDDDCRGLTQSV